MRIRPLLITLTILAPGSEGTRGLETLYQAMRNLQEAAVWQPVARTVYDKNDLWWFDLEDKRSAIDSLLTEDSVLAFLGRLNLPYQHLSFHIPDSPEYNHRSFNRRKELRVPDFEKADLDGNGRTDLLFNGYEINPHMIPLPLSYVVLSFGKDSFKIKKLSHGSGGYFFDARTHRMDGYTCLVTRKPQMKIDDSVEWYDRPMLVDTLVYMYDDFLELSRHPRLRAIDSIHMHSFPGPFSFYSDLDFTIKGDSVRLDLAEDDRDTSRFGWMSRAGGYSAVLDPMTRSRLYSILNYVDFPSAQKSYPVDWTDSGADGFNIYYDGGKVKGIGANDDAGPYWFIALRDLVMDLTHTLHWQRVSETPRIYHYD